MHGQTIEKSRGQHPKGTGFTMTTETTSVLVKSQTKSFRAEYMDGGRPGVIIAKVRWDDCCGNGHNSFAITGKIYEPERQRGEPSVVHAATSRKCWLASCGCVHKAVAKHFPQLAPLLKWHLFDSNGPMHHIANTVYLASDRDCWGWRKGEHRRDRKTGKLLWDPMGGPACVSVAADTQPHALVEYEPSLGEGKGRELDAARRAAVWPNATEELLSWVTPDDKAKLEAALKARIPAMLAEFRAAVESLGLTY